MINSKLVGFSFLFLLCASLMYAIGEPLVSAQATYSVTFSQTTGGIIRFRYANDPLHIYGAGTYSIVAGRSLEVTTLAQSGYVFSHFAFTSSVANGTTTVNPLQTTVQSSFTLQAVFVSTTQDYATVTVLEPENGSISTAFGGVTYGWGEFQITKGSYVTFTATAILAHDFLTWEISGGIENGNVSTNPLTIYVASDFTIRAYFITNDTENELRTLTFRRYTSFDGETYYYSGLGGLAWVDIYPTAESEFAVGRYYSDEANTQYDFAVGQDVRFFNEPYEDFEFMYYLYESETVEQQVITDETFAVSVIDNFYVYAMFKAVAADDGGGGSGVTDYWAPFTTSTAKLVYGIILYLSLCILLAKFVKLAGLMIGLLISAILSIMFLEFPSWTLAPVVVGLVFLILIGRK